MLEVAQWYWGLAAALVLMFVVAWAAGRQWKGGGR